MNLVKDRWIPVGRRSGKVEHIAPWQLTDGFADDPFIRLAAPRPDFNGALVQFLIGLLQTCFAPKDEREWRWRLRLCPSVLELEDAFSRVRDVFFLDEGDHRFLQDLAIGREGNSVRTQDLATQPLGEFVPVSALLIEAPTGKTLRDNTDHFVKRASMQTLCRPCAAAALFTLQTNAPLGGQGHLTGIRGGGPLTTLVLSDTLWDTCWQNVLPNERFLTLSGNQARADLADRFPWMSPEKGKHDAMIITPDDAHPHQVFWAMPRRIRLVFSHRPEHTACHLCGGSDEMWVENYWTKNRGTSYDGPWVHPLSPYFIQKDGTPVAVHPQPGGVGYRHWLGIIQASSGRTGEKRPAAVVERLLTRNEWDMRLWAFGYNMSNKKARCWYDSTMPVLLCPDESRASYEFGIACLVRSAELAAKALRDSLRKALFRPRLKVVRDLSFIAARFWQMTEPRFFEMVRDLRDGVVGGDDVTNVLEEWANFMHAAAEHIFDDLSQTGAFDAADPKRIAVAWLGLQNTFRSKKFRETLGLPAQRTKSTPLKGGRRSDV